MYIYIYIFIYTHTKTIFTENILATAFINSLLSTSHLSLILHFETNLRVIIYIIYINEPDNSDD